MSTPLGNRSSALRPTRTATSTECVRLGDPRRHGRRTGRPGHRRQLYRRVLEEQPNGSGTTGTVEISLAELLLDSGRPTARDDASALLGSWIDREQPVFDSRLFGWHLSFIRVASATGDRETVRRAATTALTLVDRGPRLPRHPDVGLVETDQATLERLRELAR